jgi:UDP-N-acetylmuramate dehydrogenase
VKILSRPNLQDRTWLGIGGVAQAEVRIEQPGDWERWFRFVQREGLRPLTLGRGSNLLLQDGDLPFCVVRPPAKPRPEVYSRTNERCVVRVPAGFPLPGLLRWLQDHGLAGLEGLSGIPADVGGAVAMNAGSFGQSIGQCLHRVRCWTPRTGLVWLSGTEVQYAYRSFRPLGLGREWIIHEAELVLSPADGAFLKQKRQEVLHRKRQTQPVDARTCGCTFKNPPQAPAGQLLDQCGMRGRKVGGVGFSSLHANFLINSGGGSFAQAIELIAEAKRRVRDRCGVDLDPEVRIIDPCRSSPRDEGSPEPIGEMP